MFAFTLTIAAYNLIASVDGGFTSSGVDFDWNGADEGDQVTGTGWAELRDDGCLGGEIAYAYSDDTSFITKAWPFFSSLLLAANAFDR